MKSFRSKTLILTITTMLLASLFMGSSVFAAKQTKSPMQQYVEAMQPGWNLGNTFDSVGLGGSEDPASEDETAWGNPNVTREQYRVDRRSGIQEHPHPDHLRRQDRSGTGVCRRSGLLGAPGRSGELVPG